MDAENEITFIGPKRKVTSIYVDPFIWKGFMAKCRNTGSSTCHVLEAFMYAFTKALPDTPISSLPVVNVNLTVNRVVQRVHRVEKEFAGVQKKRIRVVRSDGSFYVIDAYPMDEDDYEEVMKE